MLTLLGQAVSSGIAMGQLYLMSHNGDVPKRAVDDTVNELARAVEAIRTAKEQLNELYNKAVSSAGVETAAIFEIHAMMLDDGDYLNAISKMIKETKLCAEYCVKKTGEEFAGTFSAMQDEYMKERAVDVLDISRRVADILSGRNEGPLVSMDEPVIIAAEDFLPSQTIQMDKGNVLAFISKYGSTNSHVSILARSLGIPSVVALEDGFEQLKAGDFVIVDGGEGIVTCNPTVNVLAEYRTKMDTLATEKRMLEDLFGVPAMTKDGARIELCANIGSPDETIAALKNNADGVGLFRSEFLYLESAQFPSEEKQFEAYKKALELMEPRRVVIRTLDLGADKQAPYFNIPAEENPAMGYRAIRICLDRTDVFIPQLRALLRASMYGKLAVMFPMITTVNEVIKIWDIIANVKEQLDSEGIAYSESIEFGIMIETPAAVMVADRLARMVDFFSIGTNDLAQYTFAADRMNQKVSRVIDACNVSILRMIKFVSDAAHKNGIWVGICGESASDPNLVPHFIAMEIDELSMSLPAIMKTKKQILGLCKDACLDACNELLR